MYIYVYIYIYQDYKLVIYRECSMIKYINRAKIYFLKLEKTTTKFLLLKVSCKTVFR